MIDEGSRPVSLVTGAAAGRAADKVFGSHERPKIGDMYIAFSCAAIYPRRWLALRIIHEATHKFANSEDRTYTDQDEYTRLFGEECIENADSYAYTVLSLRLNQLIKDLRESILAIPENDPADASPAAIQRKSASEVCGREAHLNWGARRSAHAVQVFVSRRD
jgi:hypothetical protein